MSDQFNILLRKYIHGSRS